MHDGQAVVFAMPSRSSFGTFLHFSISLSFAACFTLLYLHTPVNEKKINICSLNQFRVHLDLSTSIITIKKNLTKRYRYYEQFLYFFSLITYTINTSIKTALPKLARKIINFTGFGTQKYL